MAEVKSRIKSSLAYGNDAVSRKQYEEAIIFYQTALKEFPDLRNIIAGNIQLAELQAGKKVSSIDSLLNLSADTEKKLKSLYGKARNYSELKSRAIGLELFDERLYIASHPDIQKTKVDPYEHYMSKGWHERRQFHSTKYDFNAYLDAYPDVRRLKVNPIVHYLDAGVKEGRQLFYNRNYLFSLNSRGRLDIWQYLDHKQQRGQAKSLVFTINFDFKATLENPKNLESTTDYVYFGVPANSSGSPTAWNYQSLRYHFNDLRKLTTYCIFNQISLFDKYEEITFVDNPNVSLDSAAFGRAKLNQTGLVVVGEKAIVKESKYQAAIEEFFCELPKQVYDGQIESRRNECIRPSSITVKRSQHGIQEFLAAWWMKSVKFDLGTLIPMTLIDILNGHVSCELSVCERSWSMPADDYRSYMQSYFSKYMVDCDLIESKGSSKGPAVSIVIPVFNALEDVQRCLFSLESSSYENYSLYIADDASDTKVVAWLREYAASKSNVTLLENPINMGYTKNVNAAIKAIPHFDYLILLNSDTIVSGNWIGKLVSFFNKEKKVGIVGPLSNAAGWQSVPSLRGDNALPDHLTVARLNDLLDQSQGPKYSYTDLVNGFCFCVSKEVFKEIGLFDELSFPKGYGEEDDFCMRARAKGFKNIIALNTYVFHAKSKSFGHKRRVELATESRKILDKKYGANGYRSLTESLGDSPLMNAVRDKIDNYFLPYERHYSVIGEEVAIIESEGTQLCKFDSKICVHLHLYYVEMAKYFSQYLSNIPFSYDLYITTSEEVDEHNLKQVFASQEVDRIYIKHTVNKGRDVWPFLNVLGKVYKNYEYVLHIHSKKSNYNPKLGMRWLTYLMNNLLFSKSYVANLLYAMNSKQIGIAYPPVINDLKSSYSWRNNKALAEDFLSRIGMNTDGLDEKLSFPAGNMFWVRTNALSKLFDLHLSADDFPAEPIAIDGTLAHTLERSWPLIAKASGFNALIVAPSQREKFINEIKMFSERMKSPDEIGEIILKRIKEKKAFALIRYFDGEGAFYKVDSWREPYLQERMKYYFGDGKYTISDASHIRDTIFSSLSCADIVGIANLDIVQEMLEFTEKFSGGEIEKLPYIRKRYNKNIDCTSAWRILSSFELVIHALASDASFCTKDIHYELVLSGLLYKILAEVDTVSIISSQPVKKCLETIFGVSVNEFPVPQRSVDNDLNNDTGHYPNAYKNLMDSLSNKDLSGQLFLIGAGPLGKGYCMQVKKQGGVAVDVGAIFDSWLNFHTRPEHVNNSNKFNNDLLLTSDNVEKLTNGVVVPRSYLSMDELPPKKVNKLLRSRF